MIKVEVSFSPELFPVYFQSQDCVVVVIDVFRATSAICTAFEYGAQRIIPVSSIEEALEYKKKGFLVGAERGGEVVEGFDFGNSPFSYMNETVRGKDIVLTTTNGTRALNIAKPAKRIVVGSFLNLTGLCNYLIEQQKDVLLLCAGWKGRFNLEDTLFAGAVVQQLVQHSAFSDLADSAIAAQELYECALPDVEQFLRNSSHRKRLAKLDLEKDINYCLQLDTTDIVPILVNEVLIGVPTLSNVQ
jgi:2-phosphosulfolactate phosphatase